MLIQKDDVILRDIHGSAFLIDISDNYFEDKCVLYEVNETGKFLWNSMKKHHTVDDLAKALQAEIIDEVSYGDLVKDIREYIEVLKDRGFVLEVSANG